MSNINSVYNQQAISNLDRIIARHKKAGTYPTQEDIESAITEAKNAFKENALHHLHLYKKEALHKAKTPADTFTDLLTIIQSL